MFESFVVNSDGLFLCIYRQGKLSNENKIPLYRDAKPTTGCTLDNAQEVFFKRIGKFQRMQPFASLKLNRQVNERL